MLVGGILSDKRLREGDDLHLSCQLRTGQVKFSYFFKYLYANLYLYIFMYFELVKIFDRRAISDGWWGLLGAGQ